MGSRPRAASQTKGTSPHPRLRAGGIGPIGAEAGPGCRRSRGRDGCEPWRGTSASARFRCGGAGAIGSAASGDSPCVPGPASRGAGCGRGRGRRSRARACRRSRIRGRGGPTRSPVEWCHCGPNTASGCGATPSSRKRFHDRGGIQRVRIAWTWRTSGNVGGGEGGGRRAWRRLSTPQYNGSTTKRLKNEKPPCTTERTGVCRSAPTGKNF